MTGQGLPSATIRSGRVRRPPGPGLFDEIPRNPANDRRFFDKLLQARREYGDVAYVGMPGMRRYFVVHPDDVQHVLLDNARNYGKDCFEYASLRLVLGGGLVTSDGELWRRQRKLAAPAFRPRSVAGFADSMARATEEMLGRWEGRANGLEAFDLVPEMIGVALRIVGDALFGFDTAAVRETIAPAIAKCLYYAIGRAPWSLPLKYPTVANVRFRNAIATLHGIVDGIIAERRRRGAERSDLLAMLMAALDEESGEGMDDAQLRDEVLTLLVAGHETTATALSWTFWLLSRHPEVRRRVEEEVDRKLTSHLPGAEDVEKLTWTRQVIDESLRLYPAVWGIARVAKDWDEIGGYELPPRSVLYLAQWATHRHPDFWPNPEGFDPERFAPEAAAARHRFAYFPFAGGPRVCIGNNLALLEAVLILAMVSRRYRVDLVPGHPVEPQATITTRPRHGILVTLAKR
jgi:cytochrome P450